MKQPNAVQTKVVASKAVKHEEIMSCRNDLWEVLNDPPAFVGEDSPYAKFHAQSAMGWSIYFDYYLVKPTFDSDSNLVGKSSKLALRIQHEDAHDEMVALWDMHCASKSLQEFTDRYSWWYEKKNFPEWGEKT
tara:strand:- start:2045 stop:2443 length:399 start_codon:yes stop_codon:yes gene_type:complete